MAAASVIRCAKPQIFGQAPAQRIPIFLQAQPICRCHRRRLFSSSTKLYRQQNDYKESFGRRLRRALNNTKIKWYPIPVGVGIGFLGLGQLYRVNEREKAKRREGWEDDGLIKSTGSGGEESDGTLGRRPKRRERIRPTGPWFVHVSPYTPKLLKFTSGRSKLCPHCH
jgi:phosphatidylserine decarboxylase